MMILLLVEHVDSYVMLICVNVTHIFTYILNIHIYSHIFRIFTYIQNMLFRRLESQYTGALERSQIIKDELILERQNNDELKCVM